MTGVLLRLIGVRINRIASSTRRTGFHLSRTEIMRDRIGAWLRLTRFRLYLIAVT